MFVYLISTSFFCFKLPCSIFSSSIPTELGLEPTTALGKSCSLTTWPNLPLPKFPTDQGRGLGQEILFFYFGKSPLCYFYSGCVYVVSKIKFCGRCYKHFLREISISPKRKTMFLLMPGPAKNDFFKLNYTFKKTLDYFWNGLFLLFPSK